MMLLQRNDAAQTHGPAPLGGITAWQYGVHLHTVCRPCKACELLSGCGLMLTGSIICRQGRKLQCRLADAHTTSRDRHVFILLSYPEVAGRASSAVFVGCDCSAELTLLRRASGPSATESESDHGVITLMCACGSQVHFALLFASRAALSELHKVARVLARSNPSAGKAFL